MDVTGSIALVCGFKLSAKYFLFALLMTIAIGWDGVLANALP